jgi:hypothetical protein
MSKFQLGIAGLEEELEQEREKAVKLASHAGTLWAEKENLESHLAKLVKAVEKLKNRRFQVIGPLYDALEELYKVLEEPEEKLNE